MYNTYTTDKTHQSLEEESAGRPEEEQEWNLVGVECGMFFLRLGWEQ